MTEVTQPRSWSDLLLTGVGAIIDSQQARNYALNDPVYNTAGGRAGQSQQTLGAQIAGISPVVWIIGAVAFLGLVLLVKR